MAVYTDVSFEDLEVFLHAYDIGRPHVFKGIAEGVSNSNYYLETDRGRFILTLYEKRIDTIELPFFLELMDHLAKTGVPCPTPIPNRAGAHSSALNGRIAAILTFLDGVSLHRPLVEHCAVAGYTLAKLHQAGEKFSGRRNNSLGIEAWRSLAGDCSQHADQVADGLQNLIGAELRFLSESWPNDLPVGIIHADFFPDNVLFLGTIVSGVIDFYFACYDALAYDLAVALNAWCFESDGAFNATKSRALITGYQSIRPLTDLERTALPVLSRGAALRFLLTRLYDWTHKSPDALVRPKDPRQFEKRLRFHRAVRSPKEYGL